MVITHFLNSFYGCIFSREIQKWYQNFEIIREGGSWAKKTFKNSVFEQKQFCQIALVNI